MIVTIPEKYIFVKVFLGIQNKKNNDVHVRDYEIFYNTIKHCIYVYVIDI